MSSMSCYFCGGKECKYENWKNWLVPPYINACAGVFSTWITDEIMALQRPSTRLNKEFDLPTKLGINSIFNLQVINEHPNCGDGIEESSGFAYLPEDFMNEGVFYYNFGWTDMSTPELSFMLNLVQVMSFALEGDKKIGVHCHAGLGRTGLAIACYLVYSRKMDADKAIHLIRSKRPLSIQTKKQVNFLYDFQKYLEALLIVFPQKNNVVLEFETDTLISRKLSLSNLIARQNLYYHGDEQRASKNIPKLVSVIIEKIKKLMLENPFDLYKYICDFNIEGTNDELPLKVWEYQSQLNNGNWTLVENETEISTLINVLIYWILSLNGPILSSKTTETLASTHLNTQNKAQAMEKDELHTLLLFLDLFRLEGSNQFTDDALVVFIKLFTDIPTTEVSFASIKAFCYDLLKECGDPSFHQDKEMNKDPILKELVMNEVPPKPPRRGSSLAVVGRKFK